MHHSSASYEQYQIVLCFINLRRELSICAPFLSMGAGYYVTSPLLVSMKPSRVKAETRQIVMSYYNGYPLSLASFKLGFKCWKISSFDSNSSLFTWYSRSTSPQENRTWEYRKLDFAFGHSAFVWISISGHESKKEGKNWIRCYWSTNRCKRILCRPKRIRYLICFCFGRVICLPIGSWVSTNILATVYSGWGGISFWRPFQLPLSSQLHPQTFRFS